MSPRPISSGSANESKLLAMTVETKERPMLVGLSCALNCVFAVLALPQLFALITFGQDSEVLGALALGFFVLPWVNLLAAPLALSAQWRPRLLTATLYAGVGGRYAVALVLAIWLA